ncbi:unnamed protein product, partial [Rotaria sordida]
SILTSNSTVCIYLFTLFLGYLEQ